VLENSGLYSPECSPGLRWKQVWSGSSDGRVCSWNSKNKRLIRKIGDLKEPVSSMVPVANLLLGVLTVWVAHFDGSVSIWVSSELSQEELRRANHVSFSQIFFCYVVIVFKFRARFSFR